MQNQKINIWVASRRTLPLEREGPGSSSISPTCCVTLRKSLALSDVESGNNNKTSLVFKPAAARLGLHHLCGRLFRLKEERVPVAEVPIIAGREFAGQHLRLSEKIRWSWPRPSCREGAIPRTLCPPVRESSLPRTLF